MNFARKVLSIILVSLMPLLPTLVHAEDVPWYKQDRGTIALVYGNGNSTALTGLRVRNRETEFVNFGSWESTLSMQAEITSWRGLTSNVCNKYVTDVGLTPLLRIYPSPYRHFAPYIDMGLGIHLLSNTRINCDRVLSTSFQFGEHFEVGVHFGKMKQFGVGLFVQHVSNGGIKRPNNGLTHGGLKFSYSF